VDHNGKSRTACAAGGQIRQLGSARLAQPARLLEMRQPTRRFRRRTAQHRRARRGL